MHSVKIRFHGALCDFVKGNDRYGPQEYAFYGRLPVKDALEALGAPHPEIDAIAVNGRFSGFGELLCGGETVDAYSLGDADLPEGVAGLVPEISGRPRFVSDVHLGTLSRYLRMLGFDTLYENDYDDGTLAELSSGQSRVLLTRDRELLKRSGVHLGYWLRSTHPAEQLTEVMEHYDLFASIKPFTLCMECDSTLVGIEKSAVESRLSERTRRYYNDFAICPVCGRIYWKGSHFEKMSHFIDEIARQEG